MIEAASGVNPGSASTSYTITLTQNVNVGDFIAVNAGSDASSALSNTSISDAADGTTFGTHAYTQSTSGGTAEGGSAHRAGWWYVTAATALTAGTSKVKFTTGGTSHKTIVVYVLQAATSISVDKTAASANQAATNTPVTGTTAATTQATEVAFASFLYAGAPGFIAPSGWSQIATQQNTVTGSACSISPCYKFLSATAAQSATAQFAASATATAGGLIFTVKYADIGAPSGGTETLSGTQKVGSVLTCTSSGWSNNPTSYSYTWQRADDSGFTTNVVTAQGPTSTASTTNTYTLVALDDSKYVRCQATATNGGGTSSAANTAASSQILYPVPANVLLPVATGLVGTGQVVTCDTGSWNPA